MPFPNADFDSLEKEPQKEIYIFEDKENPKAPIVVLFPLVNVTYKHFKRPGMPILSGWILLKQCCFYYFIITIGKVPTRFMIQASQVIVEVMEQWGSLQKEEGHW